MEKRELSEEQLQALLRVKRHEQPPPGYFDDLLHHVHRRQREDLLRRPAWRLFFDRLRGFFSSLDWNYAAAMGIVLMVGIVVIRLSMPGGHAKESNFADLSHGKATPVKVDQPQPGKTAPTRFPIEAMPASYEPTPIRF